MSAKWQRSKRWDDAFFPAWAWPAKATLRAFSSIWLAVVLLTGVALYGTLASVPVGMLALGLTWAFYALTLVLAVAALAVPGAFVVDLAARRLGRAPRFVLDLAAGVVLAFAGWWLWRVFAWPALAYNPATGEGVRFFPAFVEAYRTITIRRLPGFEMTELEFYSWWPMRLLLLLFVVNMVVATVRRIEFGFKYIGVLTVHAGIVVIALGSVYYQALKKEGDTLLIAKQAPMGAVPDGPGPAQGAFFDNTHVVLFVGQPNGFAGATRWEQRPLRRLPRYNDYALDAGDPEEPTLWDLTDAPPPWEGLPERPLDLRVPQPPPASGVVDPDIRFRVTGYASYAEPREDYIRRVIADVPSGEAPNPLRTVEIFSRIGAAAGEADRPAFRYTLFPADPTHRISDNGLFAVEYAVRMDPRRWAALTEPLPPGTLHALVITVPGAGPDGGDFREVRPVRAGDAFAVGATGFRIEVEDILPRPPLEIITEGYRGATSSVALLHIDTPDGRHVERTLYHRFPEIEQDIAGAHEDGRPVRTDADKSMIRVDFVDASQLQIYFDEPGDGSTRVAVRMPGGPVRVIGGDGFALRDRQGPNGPTAEPVSLAEAGDDAQLTFRVAERWEHAERFERPAPVPEAERENEFVGTHERALVAVEVTSERHPGWSRTLWLPFTKYMGVLGEETIRRVHLPDGRRVDVAFGRRRHVFPDFQLQLVDFEMIAYDHRGAPRDYQSVVRVTPRLTVEQEVALFGGREVETPFEPYEHVVKLNAPLRAPHHWSERRSWFANAALRIFGGLNPGQFKLSQAGWDQQGWQQSQQLADQGLLPKPYARFTILGVGNNPGIHVIAFGGILMALGTPWAFYVKPWLVRREQRRRVEATKRRVAARAAGGPGAHGGAEIDQQQPGRVPAGATA